MLKNPVVLVAVALLVAALAFVLARGLQPKTDLQPLVPPPGESLRRQGVPPKPTVAEAKQVLPSLEGAALPPGDAAVREVLRAALSASEAPSYRLNLDAPFDDAAGRQVGDEVREWIDRKMAGLGFEVADSGKPSLVWRVRIDPGEAGAYTLGVALRAGGESKLDQQFTLPAAYTRTRLDTTFASAFAPPRVAPAEPARSP